MLPSSIGSMLMLSLVLVVVAGCAAVGVVFLRRTRATLARLVRTVDGLATTVKGLTDAQKSNGEHAAAGAKALVDMREQVQRLERGVSTVMANAPAQADALGAVLRQTQRAVATRIDLLADWMARGASPDARTTLARELEERDFFVETLSEGRIRPLQLPQLFPGIERQAVEIGVIDPDTKHPNHVDMLYVCAIVRHLRAKRVFEFGTYLGRTTYHLALSDGVEQVFTLDLDPSGDYPKGLKIGRAVKAVHERGLQGHFFHGTPVAGRVVQLHGDSRTFDYAPFAASMDLVFVDGGHTYDLVVNDTKHALDVLKPGGVIVWHDFAPKGKDVTAFAREFSRERPLFWIEDTSLLVYADGVDALAYVPPVPVYSRTLIKPE